MRGWCLAAACVASCGSRTTLDVPSVVEVALGRGWTCARTQAGGVSCWGESDVLSPQEFPAPSFDQLGRVRHISGAGNEVCALVDDGTVRCWGENSGGQLGIDPKQSPSDLIVARPEIVPNLPMNIVALSTGESFSCVLGLDASIVCFGYVPSDQPPRFDARTVFEVPAALSVSVSGALFGALCEHDLCSSALVSGYTCALDATNAVWCWGAELSGNLGDGQTFNTAFTPHRVSFGGRFTSIATSSFFACGVDESSAVFCWGNGPLTPTAVGLSDVTALAAGDMHMCALTDAGAVFCWGDNSEAQVGVARPETVIAPTRVQGLPTAMAIGAGSRHSCAVSRDGEVWCWGSNDHGQLGVGGTAQTATPVRAR